VGLIVQREGDGKRGCGGRSAPRSVRRVNRPRNSWMWPLSPSASASSRRAERTIAARTSWISVRPSRVSANVASSMSASSAMIRSLHGEGMGEFVHWGALLQKLLSIPKVSHQMKTKAILKVSIRQIKAARALLAWSQEQLAKAVGVSLPTIKRLEAQDGPLGGRSETGDKIRAGLETAGVEFINANGAGEGVRLRKSPSPRKRR
jgi:DNA-binding XRE family transcriptional regulator